MSTFLSSTDLNFSGESKHYNMKQFIRAVGEYIKTRTEDTASLINRHLQLLSVSIDYSIFDPNTSVVCEFFVSLHELLNSLEPRSALAWCCVNVLGIACKNASARNQLIHTYQFIPVLSRLLGDHLSSDKKIRLLTVMQELSCGIKISWQIPHLGHLMTTLSKWVVKETPDIIILSLGVLVNLCYKNLPAIYTLSRCVDIKQFVRTCSMLNGVQMEVNVCKLLLILDPIDGFVPEETYIRLCMLTFTSVQEAFKKKDPILLRHVVDFYLDITLQNNKSGINNHDVIIREFANYSAKVEEVLNLVDNNASGDAAEHDPECMFMIFKFFNSLIELNLPNLIPFYPRCVNIALRWIQTEVACSEALNILRTIVVNTKMDEGSKILEQLLIGVPVFLLGLQNIEEDVIMNIEHCRRLSAVMQLLRALVQAEGTRERVLGALNEVIVCKIFVPLIGNTSPRSRAVDANNCSPEAVSLYINTLVLVHELARWDSQWVPPLTTLLQHRQMHSVLAEALYSGTAEIKALILSMTAYAMFPCKQVASSMCELQPLLNTESHNSSNTTTPNLMCYPMITISQSEKLDETINMLKEASTHNNVGKISDVMELYEYKLASMGHAERAAMSSVDAASQRCTHLQHQTAQLTTEISRLRQLFIHTQQCCEDLNRQNKMLEESNVEFNNRLGAEKGRCRVAQSQLTLKDKHILEKEGQIEDLNKRLKERDNEILCLQETLSNMKDVVGKLEEQLKRQEKNSERKDDIIKKANTNIEHFKMQVVQLERELKQAEMSLKLRNEELVQVKNDLTEKSTLLNTITLAIAKSNK